MENTRAEREFQISFLEKKLQELQNAHDPGAARFAIQVANLKSLHQQICDAGEACGEPTELSPFFS